MKFYPAKGMGGEKKGCTGKETKESRHAQRQSEVCGGGD